MRAFLYGSVVRLKSDHPLDDTTLRNEDYLPRSAGLMPDNSLAVDLTRAEALDLWKEPMAQRPIRDAIHAMIFDSTFPLHLWTKN